MSDKDVPVEGVNYYELASKERKDARENLRKGEYDQAVTNLKNAGVYYLGLAKNTPYHAIRILDDALKDYQAALQILDHQQSKTRALGATNVNVLRLIKERNDLGKLIDKITSTKEALESKQKNSLGGKTLGFLTIITLVAAMLSISMNLTGNVIGGSLDNNNWLSIGLFFLGCVLTLFYFKAKANNTRTKVPHLRAHKKK